MAKRAVDIQVAGAKALRKQIKELEDFKAIQGALRGIYKAAAEVVVADAKPRVPVLTGKLRDSLRAMGSQTSGSVAIGKKKLPYASVIHFGWLKHHIKPNRFLYDAADAKADQAGEVFLDGITPLMQQVLDRADASGDAP